MKVYIHVHAPIDITNLIMLAIIISEPSRLTVTPYSARQTCRHQSHSGTDESLRER